MDTYIEETRKKVQAFLKAKGAVKYTIDVDYERLKKKVLNKAKQ